jgi:proline iminopeptidase
MWQPSTTWTTDTQTCQQMVALPFRQVRPRDLEEQVENSGTPAELAQGEGAISVDGSEQRFHVAGAGPICLIHPGGPGMSWEYLSMPSVEQHVTAVYIEPVGTGRSGRLRDLRDYTVDLYARFAAGIIKQLKLNRVFFLGHLYGGFVAQRLAVIEPDRLSGIVLYSTAPAWGANQLAAWRMRVAELAKQHPSEPDAQDMVKVLQQIRELTMAGAAIGDAELTSVQRRALPAYFADYWSRKREFASLPEMIHVFAGPQHNRRAAPFDMRAELASIRLPALVIGGRHDRMCSADLAQMLHDGIPGSLLVMFERSGHFAHIEEPGAFASELPGSSTDECTDASSTLAGRQSSTARCSSSISNTSGTKHSIPRSPTLQCQLESASATTGAKRARAPMRSLSSE